ncbi:gluzincin family metallopeptidase [Hanstruepera ponticola]|uniref:metalloprotease n=1 Tax=Hanstruepera ponticola TaxID=2042995 RepID=UPI001785DAF6|nr:metalloprotease [Hanstruepera ponticola]
MRIRYFLNVLLTVVCFYSYSQNTIDIKAKLNTENNQIKISQTITYKNTTQDTLQSIYLNDWSNSYSTKSTPLAKRFSEEFKTEFHFAKNEDRGYSVITSVKQNETDLNFERVKEQIDVLKVKLSETLQPGDSYTIQLNYIVQVPNDKFTRYGVTSNGDYNLRYWYITPAVYNGEWQYTSNKDLDDMFVPKSDIRIELTCPLKYHVVSELNQFDYNQIDGNQVFVFTGENRVNSKLFINKVFNFRQIETDFFTVVSNIDDEELNPLSKALITDNIASFLSKTLGSYPHKKLLVTDIDYKKSPIYGLNLLPDFIRPFPDYFQYELKILKTALHNYLENILLINPREDQWILDGIQTYYLMKYVDEFYPEMKLAGTLSRIWGLKSFHAAQLDFNAQYSFLYMHMARGNLDQPLTMSKDSLLKFNENIANKYKAGVGLKYLENYINSNTVENSIQEYLTSRTLKPTNTKDFEVFLKSKTDKNIDWFFTDYLQTDKVIDYTISEVVKANDSIKVTIKNRNEAVVPISLFSMIDDEVKSKIWIDPIKDSIVVVIPDNGYTKLVLNQDQIVPEFNLRNNTKDLTNALFNRPLQIRLIKDIEDPKYNQLFLMPIVEFNNIYDGIVLGVKAYNKTVLKKAFNYKISPQYGLKSKSLTGGVSLDYNQYIDNSQSLFLIRYGIGAGYQSYADDLFVTKFTPGVQFQFRDNDNLRSNMRNYLSLRYIDINRDEDPNAVLTSETLEPNYSVFNARFNHVDKDLIDFSAWFADLQIAKKFGKVALNYEYRKLTAKNRRYHLRLFAGAFLYNKTYQDSDYFSFALDRPTDYLFDYNYYGRSESAGLFSQQLIVAEGGFKSQLNPGFANQWITTLNGSTTIWKYIMAYGDVGFVKNHGANAEFVYDSGLRFILVEDYFEIFFPVYSNLGWEIAQPNYDQKIRFIVTLDFKTLLGLFSRRWY